MFDRATRFAEWVTREDRTEWAETYLPQVVNLAQAYLAANSSNAARYRDTLAERDEAREHAAHFWGTTLDLANDMSDLENKLAASEAAREKLVGVLRETRRHVSENLKRMYHHDDFGEIRRIDEALAETETPAEKE